VLQVLEGWYGAAATELRYRNPYELAVAVVLSAQCTDVQVHQTTPAFFERFPDCETLARAEPRGGFSYIRRAGPHAGITLEVDARPLSEVPVKGGAGQAF
jgi:endonuclease-3